MTIKQRVKKLEEQRPEDDGWCHCPRPLTIQPMDYRKGLEVLAPDYDGPIEPPRCPTCGKVNGFAIRPIRVDPVTWEPLER